MKRNLIAIDASVLSNRIRRPEICLNFGFLLHSLSSILVSVAAFAVNIDIAACSISFCFDGAVAQ